MRKACTRRSYCAGIRDSIFAQVFSWLGVHEASLMSNTSQSSFSKWELMSGAVCMNVASFSFSQRRLAMSWVWCTCVRAHHASRKLPVVMPCMSWVSLRLRTITAFACCICDLEAPDVASMASHISWKRDKSSCWAPITDCWYRQTVQLSA